MGRKKTGKIAKFKAIQVKETSQLKTDLSWLVINGYKYSYKIPELIRNFVAQKTLEKRIKGKE